MKKQILKLVIGLAIAAVFLAILFHHLDVSRVWFEMKNIQGKWLAFALGAMALSFFIRAERWRQILVPHNAELPTAATWRIFLMGIAGNVLLPFRLGDLLRGTFFARRLGVPVGSLMTSVLIEKMCDLVFIVLLGGVALIAMPEAGHSEAFHLGGTMIFAVGFIALGFLFCARWLRRPVLFTATKALQKTPKLSEKLLPIAGHIFDALDMIARPSVLVKVMGFSALTWLFEWLTFIFIALGMPSLAKPMASLVSMPLATLSTALPGAPGGVGTFDFFAEEVMKLLGNARDASTAYAFLVHAVILAVPVFMAMFALFGQDWKNVDTQK